MIRFLYGHLLKPLLFRLDPEWVHDVFVDLGEVLGRYALARRLVSMAYGYPADDALVTVDGLQYRTPVVLAAGFDYNGRLCEILRSVGFGGVEVGSVTARPTAGNPPPRLARLVRSRSLLVNKGLRNEGAECIAQRLRKVARSEDFVVGVSIARTNDAQAATVAGGVADYCTTLKRLVELDVGDYYTINISCPNVHGGESFTEPSLLRRLLEGLNAIKHDRPVYAKMPIDVTDEAFDELMQIIAEFGLAGVVIGNLAKDYGLLEFPDEAPPEYRGGISGRPCFEPSNRLIRRARDTYGDRLTIIGCGGILSAQDAIDKFRAGAELVQLITGMIFEGPHLMKMVARAYATWRATPDLVHEATEEGHL